MTADNGSEFAFHYKLVDALGNTTDFADPNSEWHCGTNEPLDGRIRKYLLQNTSFENLTQAELNEFRTEIDNRPHKILGWAIPTEYFQELGSQ